MTSYYLNINQWLADQRERQRHIERYVGLKGIVETVFSDHQDLNTPVQPEQWQTRVLLIAQEDASQNGVYDIDEEGNWNQLTGDLEQGNLIACRESKTTGTDQTTDQYDYYQLKEYTNAKQIWQHFQLGDLNLGS